jgi:hypothetical protein
MLSKDFLIIEPRQKQAKSRAMVMEWAGIRVYPWRPNLDLGAAFRGNPAFPQNEANTND